MNKLAAMTLAAAVMSSAAPAENWPNWRGPNHNGSTGETGLPASFSKTENVKWSAPMPGPSAATPAIWGDTVFVSSSDEPKQKLHAIALDRKTGKVLWDHPGSSGYRKDNKSTFSSPSPVTDGERAVFFYSNGDLIAYDFAGKELWRRNIQADYGEFAFNWTFSSSPTLFGGVLYLQVIQRDVAIDANNKLNARAEGQKAIPSFLLAMDPATGKTLWQQERNGSAVAESRESFGTAIPFTHQGRTELLIAGCDEVTGHDPKTGKELWRWGSWNPQRIPHWRLVGSPVGGGGVVLVSPPKGEAVIGFKAGAAGKGAIAWKGAEIDKELASDVATPLYYMDHFYIQFGDKKQKALSCVEPATGKVVWKTPIDTGRYVMRSSPTGADGKIWTMDHNGKVYVFDARTGKLLHSAAMGEQFDDETMSSIAVSQGNLFIRTNGKLWCIGK